MTISGLECGFHDVTIMTANTIVMSRVLRRNSGNSMAATMAPSINQYSAMELSEGGGILMLAPGKALIVWVVQPIKKTTGARACPNTLAALIEINANMLVTKDNQSAIASKGTTRTFAKSADGENMW